MGVQVRKFDRGYKSLMHFDYPYFAEPGDGMRDEIDQLTWEAAGNAKFVGTEIPVAENVANTPLFGYRCLQTAANTDYIEGTKSGYMDLDASKAMSSSALSGRLQLRQGILLTFSIMRALRCSRSRRTRLTISQLPVQAWAFQGLQQAA